MKPQRPYLYYAFYNWILDSDCTPYLAVDATYPEVDVPTEYIRDGKIILNISPQSIGQYIVNDEAISFSARFQGMLRNLYIPFGAVEALYARENGEGTIFPQETYYNPDVFLERLGANQTKEESKPKTVKRKTSHLKLVK